MADEQPQPGATDPTGQPGEGQGGIGINVLTQYVKDLSFENPRAPASLNAQNGQPQIDVQVGVQVGRAGQDNVYEVVLNMRAEAKTGEDLAFIVELAYGGIFQLQNVPEDMLGLVLNVEGPRMLFPFARRIFADAVRDGGFPQLMLEPIDFLQLAQRQAQQQGGMPGPDGNGGAGGPQGGAGGNGGGGETPNIILPS